MTTLLLTLALMQPPTLVAGGVTFYGGRYIGQNLSCPGYRYEESTGPWLALDISEYASGRARCGDWYRVTFSDGSTMLARALDSGYLADANVWDTGLPFVGDLPAYWREGRVTATGSVMNVSARGRWQREVRQLVTIPRGIQER